MKQYPAYIMQLLPVPLAALAKLPVPEADLTHQVHDLAPEVLDSLRGAMREAADSSNVTSASKADEASAAGTSRILAVCRMCEASEDKTDSCNGTG